MAMADQGLDESVHQCEGERWVPLGKGLGVAIRVKRKDSKNFRKRAMSEILLSGQVFYTEQNCNFQPTVSTVHSTKFIPLAIMSKRKNQMPRT